MKLEWIAKLSIFLLENSGPSKLNNTFGSLSLTNHGGFCTETKPILTDRSMLIRISVISFIDRSMMLQHLIFHRRNVGF